jgi:hypothetical protein
VLTFVSHPLLFVPVQSRPCSHLVSFASPPPFYVSCLPCHSSKSPSICTTSLSTRSEAEVEQILSSNKHVPDPRDFYASDSPVLEYHIASGQELYESAEE